MNLEIIYKNASLDIDDFSGKLWQIIFEKMANNFCTLVQDLKTIKFIFQ